jgi:membrane peptidoglycan carboxypeptidase
VDHQGKVVYQYKPPQPQVVVSPEHAYLITSILSDNEARAWMFGTNSVLNLPFPVAAKTGTTNDFRDNWTMGYTPDLATGVWVGNADYTPMVNTTGLTGAAPIWSQFMTVAVPYVTQNNPGQFQRPPGIVDKEICILSGTVPSQWCNSGTRMEVFKSDQPPLPPGQDLRRQINIDTWTGLEASDACQNYTEKAMVINVTDPWARKWLETGAGRNWLDEHNFSSPPIYAPDRECSAGDPRPTLALSINDGDTITQPDVTLTGTASATDAVRSWKLEVGVGNDPNNWTTLAQGDQAINNAPFLNWDLSNLPNQMITLHLHMQGKNGYADKYVHFKLNLPQPTETPAPPTPTDTPNPNTAPSDTPEPPTEAPTPSG